MNIIIANTSDIEELAKVEIESKKKSLPELFADDPISINYTSRLQRWQTYFNGESPQTSKPERIILKAVIDEKIVGFIAGHLTTRFGLDAEIQNFYILKEHQRKGIGTALLKKFIEWLQTLTAQSLCVGIADENKYRTFYLKHGGKYLNAHWIIWNELPL